MNQPLASGVTVLISSISARQARYATS